MSADLFAQFGPFAGGGGNAPPPNPPPPNQPQAQPNAQSQQPSDDPFAFLSAALSAPAAPAQPRPPAPGWGGRATAPGPALAADNGNDDDDDDDDGDDTWGDFEEASPGGTATAPMPNLLSASGAPPPPPASQPPARTRIVRAATLDLMTTTLVGLSDEPPPGVGLSSVPEPGPTPRQAQPWLNPRPAPTPKPEPVLAKPMKPADPNVLFDVENLAEEEEDDDDEWDPDDDEFGDFETGDAALPQPRNTVTAAAPPPPPPPPAQPLTALIDLLSLSDPEPVPSAAAAPAPVAAPAAFPGLDLAVPPASTRSSRPAAASLLTPLSFGSTSAAAAATQATPPPKSPSFHERNPFPGLAVTTPQSASFPTDRVQNRTPSPVTEWPSLEAAAVQAKGGGGGDSDSWDAWASEATAPQSGVEKEAATAAAAAAAGSWDWDAEEPAAPAADADVLPSAIAQAAMAAPKTLADKAPPPTNVPPPSILLSLFPSLLALPEEALFKPMAAQPADVRSRIVGDPRTVAFLRNYLQIAVVAGRVVAGRKQRWHRDKFLAQSMSISAAGSSRGGGMKLAGLDKAHSQREDREAADVVAAWRRQVGKLRSAVAAANAALAAGERAAAARGPPLTIPELASAALPVTTAKAVPTAARPCVVCGLRRDERVRGIDGDDVQDLFGEWWVEHWGHRACRNFWAEHEAALRSR